MARVCYICGKKPKSGRTISRRGMAKSKGGVGQRITGKTLRRFSPNLQKVTAVVDAIFHHRIDDPAVVGVPELERLTGEGVGRRLLG